jgi:uncharacterized membrane protein YphA (DoxX/SURF4 family)
MNEKITKIIVESSRLLLGIVFIFSGFVKAVDPLGSAYKFEDYFIAFGIDFPNVFTIYLSIALSALEFALGVCILLAVYRRFSSILILLFMSFMTPLTLWLAIANPVHDCGCFGDAWVITNWQTFFKNLLLLAAAIVLFVRYKKMTLLFSYKVNRLIYLFTYAFILVVSAYCYQNLPVLDFRPYKKGNNIPELMLVPEGKPADQDITTFIYEKDGRQEEFTLENAPLNDPAWTFVDAKNIVVKGYQPPVHDFVITTGEGIDITDDVLSDTTYTFLLISPKLEKARESNADRINEIYDYALHHHYRFYCLTASSAEKISDWIDNTGAEYPICTMDETTLKTIVRSNPGLALIKNGTIYNKWHNNNLPKSDTLQEPLEVSPLGKISAGSGMKVILTALLLFAGHLLMFYWIGLKAKRLLKKETKHG